MKSYYDLIDQTFDFPTNEFKVNGKYLEFHDVPLKDIIQEHGTPLRITYLPKISQNIQSAKNWFEKAMKKHKY